MFIKTSYILHFRSLQFDRIKLDDLKLYEKFKVVYQLDLIVLAVVLVLMLFCACSATAQLETNDFEIDNLEYKQKYDQAIVDGNKSAQAELLETIVKDYNAQGVWDSVYKYNEILADTQLALGNKERYLNAYMINISISDLLPKIKINKEHRINTIAKYMEDPDLHMFRRSEIASFVANYLFYNVDRDSSLIFLDKAINYGESDGVDKQYPLSYRFQKAIFLTGMGRNVEAIEQLMIIVDREDFSLNSAYFRWQVYDELGDLFLDVSDFSKAEYYYNSSIRLAAENGYEYSKAYSTLSLGELNLLEGNLDQSKILTEKSLKTFIDKDKFVDALNAYLDLGHIYLKTEKFSELKSVFESIEETLKKNDVTSKNNGKTLIGNYNLLKGEYYLKLNNTEGLKSALADIYSNKTFYAIPRTKMKVCRLEYECAKSSNKLDDALKFHEDYISIRDSIETASNNMRVQVIESQFNRREQNKKIEILDAVTEEQKKSLSLRNNALISGGVMLAFLTGLLIGLYRLYKKNKEYQSKLEAQNITIQNALAENKVLIKEIHHRVKNNLQVISSLLSLQERKVTDKNTKDALKSSKTRVETMSILHQSLYQGEEVRGIGVKEYFTDLVSNLIDTYTVNDNIKTKIDIDELKIDVDSMIPLGLVANELICNAIKHGIGEDDKGSIFVSLKDNGDEIVLTVEDSGGSLETKVLVITEGSLGVKLINAFANRLDGKLNVQSGGSTKITLVVAKENINFIDE